MHHRYMKAGSVMVFHWFVFFAGHALLAQTQTLTSLDGSTPNAQAPGTPRGTYFLSPNEGVNLSNGNVLFSVELHRIEGRGNTGYSMVLPIQTKWTIETHPHLGEASTHLALPAVWPYLSYWERSPVSRYSPGKVVRRGSADPAGATTCATDILYQGGTLTTIAWIEADGTEHTLRDTQRQGAAATVGPYTCSTTAGPSRGTVFEADDSSAATFISDSPLFDDVRATNIQVNSGAGVAGWLLFRDGRRYQTDGDGDVILIEDKNGNQTTICYSASTKAVCQGRNYTNVTFKVVDSLGRETDVQHGSGSTTDTIKYTGSDGTRTVTVTWGDLSANLRSGISQGTYETLFPTADSTGNINFRIVSSITLPDSASKYSFKYNGYGELARVDLPAGGAYEYDYPASTTDCSYDTPPPQSCAVPYSPQGVDEQAVFRRVLTRRAFF